MNKIFKVVWSKTKECYVVVSEVAKNNGGKKKVLASVLAGLAMVGVAAQMGTPVQADSRYNKSTIVVAPNGLSPAYSSGTYKGSENNDVSYNSIVVGFLNNAYDPSTNGHFIFGANNKATNESTLALGNNNEATGPSSTAIGSGSEATGRNTIAMGNVAKANQIGNLAIGSYAKAQTSGTFMSTVTHAPEEKGYAVALGGYAEATEHSTVAVGAVSKASGFKATAVGAGAQAKGDNSTVVGTASVANSGDSFVGGFKNVTHGDRNVAVGTNNTVAGEDSIGVGSGVIATTGKTIAIGNTMVNPTYPNGRQTIARGKNKLDGSGNPMYGTTDVDNIFALAIGNGAQADGTAKSASGMIAIGQEVTADNNNTVAIGVQTKATGSNALAIGSTAQAIGASSAAFGTQAVANGLGATAFGPGASAGDGSTVADGSTAVGRKSTVTAEGGTGIGWATTVSAKDATAIGHSATANIVGGVALGSNSVTTTAAGVQGYNPATGRTNKYSDQNAAVGTSTLAAVSVGNGTTATRQITGLAAGTDDTDAVNVAQLKNVNLKYAADTGNSDVLLKDGTLKVKGDNDLISTSVVATGADKGAVQITAKVGGTINNTDGKAVKPTTNGIATTDNVADAINNSYWKATAGGNTDGTPSVGNVKPGTQVTYSAGDNLKVKQTIAANGNQEYKYSLNPVLTGITSIANTTTGPKMTFGGNSINITGGSLDMGNNKITNLATGTDDKDAVNVKQLKDTEIHITPGTYTPDSNKKVTLTYENGDNKTIAGKTAVIDLSGLATGGTASTESVVKKAAATGDTNIADVSVAGGKAVNDPGAQYEVSVSKNAVKDAAREAVTVNNGGNTDNPISVTPTQDNTNHNTTYAVTFDGNKAAKQIPLTYKATNGTITTADQTVKLDKGLNFTGGDYTTASVGADGKVTFDVTLGTAPTVTDGKPGVPGQAGAAGKDGIATVKTVVDTINNSGWKANAKANGGNLDGSATATVVKPGNTVNYAAGKNITVKQELETDGAGALTGNQTYTYSLNKDIDLTSAGSVTTGNTKVDNGGVTITAPAGGTTSNVTLTQSGLNNGGNKITNVAEGTNNTDAVNVKQLKENRTEVKAGDNVVVTTAADPTDNHTIYTVNAVTPAVYTTPDGEKLTKDKDGKFHKVGETAEYTGDIITSFENPKAAAGQTTKDGGMIVNNIGSAIKNQNPTMPAGQTATYLDKLKAAADNNSNVKNAAVNVSDLHNTAEALKANELHIRPTASNRTGETVNKNTAGTADEVYKYDATTKSVTLKYNDGTGAGVTGTEAKIDLSDLANQITSGYTFKANATANGGKVDGTATATAVENGGTINYTAGKNLTVKQDIDATNKTHTYTYSLDKDLTNLDKVVVNGKDGQAGKDGVTIVGPQGATGATGIPGTNGIDGKVGISGKDGKDAVSIAGKDGVGTIGLTGPQGPAGTNGKSVDISTENGTQTLVKPEANNNNQSQRIVYVPKDANGNPLKDDAGNTIKREVATMDDGLKFTGNNESTVNKHNLGSLVKVQGEGTKEGTNAAGTKEIQTSDGTKFESAKDNIAVEANNGDTLTVKLNKNLKGLDSVQTKTVELGDYTTPGSTTNITYNPTDKRIEYTTPGTTQTKKVATTDDIWTIQGDGTDVAPVGGKVNVKAGENILITTPTTADGSMTINAVTPAVYTDKNGNKLTKDKDGKFHKPDGTEVQPADVITSIQDAAGNVTGGNSIVNNVGSAIKNAGNAGDSFLTKLDAANTTTPNAAVNVSDLKNTADGLTNKGLRFDANEGNEKTNKLGSKVTVQGTGALSTGKAYADEYNTANIRTKIEQGTDGNTTINVGLAKALKDINSISNGGSSITISDVPAGATTPAVTISGGNLSMGNGTTNNKIVNLAPGTDGTDAVNVKQLKDTELHITPGTYTPGADKKVKLTYTDGNNAVVTGKEAVIDLSGLSTGGTTASSWNVKSSANTTDGGAVADNHNANAQNIADGKSVEFQSGKNLVVKQTNDTANGNATVEFSLSDNITAGKNGANGKDGSVGVTGKDGSSVVINGADGSIGMTGPKGQDGKDGINGRDGANLSMTSAKGEQVLVNRDPAHNADTDKAERIVYVPKDASGNPIQDANGKNIVREVATMDDGLKFTGNNTTIENKQKLGSLVKVQGEGTKEGTTVINTTTGEKEIVLSDGTTKFESAKDNIAVVADGTDTLTVKLNKNIKGLDSVQTKTVVLGDPSVTNGTTNITYNPTEKRIEYVTPDAAGTGTTTNKVANLADELHIQDTTYTIGDTTKRATAAKDEVTLTYKDGNGNEVADKYAIIKGVANSDLSNISDAGKKNITKLGSIVKAGDNVTVSEASDATTGQKTYTVNAVTPAVYTKADGTKVIKRPDGTFTTNLDGSAGNDVPASDVIVSFQDAAGNTTGGNSIVNNVGSAIDKPGTATGNTFLTQLDNAAATTPFAAVNVRDLKTTADALKANERHIAPTSVATGSTENKGGTTVGTENVYKYDATTKKVTLTYNDGKGNAVTDTKAVIDFSALNTGGTGASSWNIASDKVSATEGAVATGSAGTQNIADGKTVTMKAGKNLTVNQSNDGAGNASVAFSLDKNLENLDKVVVNGNDGATGQAGVSIVGPKGANGVDGNDGKVGIAGKDGKDAVSISGKDGVGHIGLQGPKGTPGTPGADGANLDITTDHGTQTLVKPERNNNNQSERIVYVPKDANGNPLKDTDGNDIKREVATMDDGLKFTGNNESTENKQKLGSLVKVQGEGTKESTAVDPATGKKYVVLSDGTTKFESAKDNIAVEADGTDTLTVKLNKNLKGLNSIQLGGNTIQSNGDNITFTTNGGTTKTVATTDQLWTIQANGTDVPAKSGKVNLVAGDHITITPDAANGKMTISATGFGSMDGFNVKTSAESATVGTHAGDTTENIKNGKTVDMQAGKNLVVTQSNDGNGNTTVNYALNKDVNLGTNGSLKTGDTTINNDGFKNGNTTVGGNGMTIKNPTDPTKTVSLTKDGLNNGGNQITNVASGGNVDTNAANIGDIKRLAKDTRIKDGTYTVDNNGTVELTYVDGAGNQVKDASGNAITAKITGLTTLDSTRVNVAVNETGSGKAVGSKAAVKVTKGTEFVAGDNLIVERKANAGTDVDNSVVYSLNKDLKGIETIKNGNTTITLHNNPTTATDPTAVTITGGNINMGGNRIVNVAPAKAGTDAVNLDQLKAARTHVTSKDGTVTVTPTEDKTTGQMTYDLHVTPGQSPDLTRITNKVDQLGEEIGRVGAQGAALSALKPIQYDPLEPTQIMAGYGNYRGNSAVALGVAHYKNESTLIHGGVSWAGGSSHMMANAGVTWKVGNRDSEAAVADRYRKGPISSAYAMQQEMAAMKAQNAGLKGEVSDLKAENEQMKAQIAAMMAKLGL